MSDPLRPYLSARDRFAELVGLDPTIDRGTLLPIGTDSSGQTVLAWPQMAVDAASSFMLPGHVVQGGAWTPEDATRMALDVGMLGTGGQAARAVAGGREGVQGLLDPAVASMSGTKPGAPLDGAVRVVDDLPMDEASRMARAREMGFDREVYHAAHAPFDEFDPDLIGSSTDAGQLGRGFYVSTDPNIASNEPILMPLMARVHNPLRLEMRDWDGSKLAMVREAMDLPADASPADITRALAVRGFDGVELDYSPLGYAHQEIMVPEASQLRSRFARFDPAKADSSDLLAADVGGGVAGGILSLDRYLEDTDRKRNRAR